MRLRIRRPGFESPGVLRFYEKTTSHHIGNISAEKMGVLIQKTDLLLAKNDLHIVLSLKKVILTSAP
jgi:hypothetical protein